MFVVDGTPRPAAYVAAQIYQVWIEDATTSFIKTFFNTERPYIPPNKRDPFALKTRLYCEAAALRVLLTEKQNDVRYLDLVREFEKLIFPSSPTSEGMAKLEAVKSAMIDIGGLISEKKELSWARSWFSGIGHDETNPATLVMFVRLLGLNTKSLRELIHEIGPPSEC